MDSQATLEKIYEVLNMLPGESVVTPHSLPRAKYESILFKLAREKLGIESIYFYRAATGTSTPYIFFHKLESHDVTERARILANLHKLAWNMGRAPLLFAALPDGHVRIYDTFTFPTEPKANRDYQTGLIEPLHVFTQAEKLRQTYRREEFESGRFWQQHQGRFDTKKRVDQTLLQNLKIMHQALVQSLAPLSRPIASDIVHSLLGRTIFIKYLEDRRDSAHKNVFPANFWSNYVAGATCFLDILSSKEVTYQLFEYLNKDKFNGDLFPVQAIEKEYIGEIQLKELKFFLSGQANLKSKQLSLWKYYSFDVIPIEFISSIYEEFFHTSEKEKANAALESPKRGSKTGTHYTPHHLVELMVDEVLPWEGQTTNCKTLDPACGSGIFLVEIYRRLIARWEQAHPNETIQFTDLSQLLTDNIFGVDLDSNAVHVAAFSLYLTMCDFLEPQQIWEQVRFVPLRDRNLFCADFFNEQSPFNTHEFDLVIGNPPWESKLTHDVTQYQQERHLKLPDKQIALAFMWRSVEFCNTSGEICLLMPSKGLLFNRSGTHQPFRRNFLTTYHVKTIINLSAYRLILFPKSKAPGAVILYTPNPPQENVPILYCSPKPTHTSEDKWQFIIEPNDIVEIPREEAIENDIIWKVAMWGGPRDYELIKKLNLYPYQTLENFCENRNWIHAEGVIEGNKKDDALRLVGKPYVDVRQLTRFAMNENILPKFTMSKLQRSAKTQQQIFAGPHILIKQSPTKGEKTLKAALLCNEAIFTQSIVGIAALPNDINLLAECCLILNSPIPLYYAMMISSRWLIERDELEKDEIMHFPIPELVYDDITFNDLQQLATDPDWEAKVQAKVQTLYQLTPNELYLIGDALTYTLDYFHLEQNSQAVKSTFDSQEKHLTTYLKVIQQVLQNSFGEPFQPIIFQGNDSPLRVIALNWVKTEEDKIPEVIIETSREKLTQTLNEVNQYLTDQRSPNVFIKRHVRAYIGHTIYLIKPDQKRHWTRSMALRDADEIYAEIMASREM